MCTLTNLWLSSPHRHPGVFRAPEGPGPTGNLNSWWLWEICCAASKGFKNHKTCSAAPTSAETECHFFFTCTGASIGQVGRDGDSPALIHTHALQTFINASDEPALPEQAHLGVSSLMAVKEVDKDKGNVSSGSINRGCKLWRKG